MKSEGAIRHKLKNVIFYHLKKTVKKKMVQKSWNCVHGSEKPSRIESGAGPSVCYKCTLLGGACDDNDETVPSRARQCPHFASKHDPEQIKSEFQSELETLDAGELAYRYPDVFALMWVLDMDKAGDLASSVEAIDTEEVIPPSPIEPLIERLTEVRDAMTILNGTLSSSPPPTVAENAQLEEQVQELRDRLGGLEQATQVPAEVPPRGFWANLFAALK